MKTHLLFKDRISQINSIDTLPRVGDTIIDTDLTYIVKEVIFNYDNATIGIRLKRPNEE